MIDRSPNSELERLRWVLRRRDEQRAGEEGTRPDPAETLARALLGEGAADLTCADAQDALPDYVEQELRGVPVTQRLPELTRHLLSCPTCSELHAAMLDRELVPQPTPLPVPDMAALRQRWQQEGQVISASALARRIVAQLRRDLLSDLEEKAALLRDLVNRLGAVGGAQPALGGALSMSAGGEDDAGPWLVATYLATRRLTGEELSSRRGGEGGAGGRWSATVRQHALRAALDARLSTEAAASFADEYTRLVTMEVEWQTLIS